jgi:hypothetical protein
MKVNDFRIEAIAFGLGLLCISVLQPVYAGGDAKGSAAKESPAKAGAAGEAGGSAKSAPTAPGAAAAKHTAAVPHAPANTQNNITGGAGSGNGLTGSELTGSELTGSELTGSQLTGFGVGFTSPSFLPPPFPRLAPESSDIERVRQPSSPPDEGRTPNPVHGAIAPVADTPASSAYGDADMQLRSAQSNYDAALARIRERLNQNAAYRQARAGQTGPGSAPTTSPSADAGSVDAALKIAEMENKAIAADPEANAAKQKLDEAVLARANAERAQAAPRATANVFSQD